MPDGWAMIARMIQDAIDAARADGAPMSETVRTLAYGVAATLRVPLDLPPAVRDDEHGGAIFFWKGRDRQIEIEIEASTLHLVRISDGRGHVSFEHEAYGVIPLGEVNDALATWNEERQSSRRS